MNEIVKSGKNTAALLVNQMQGQFAKVLPKILPPERFCRVVITAMNKNPALAEALSDSRNQASVLSAMMRCAEMGLEPDGRKAAITCYKKKSGGYDVTLVPMYQGLSELAMRSGLISSITAQEVCENDVFEWNLGRITKHTIDWQKPRGNVYAFYCHVDFKDGATRDEVMTVEEVNKIRDKSSGYQYAKRFNSTCPWMEFYPEMGKKTVFRRCSKWLPLSPELRQAIEADDSDYTETATEIKHAANDKFAQATGIVDVPAEQTIDVSVPDQIPDDGQTAGQETNSENEESPENLFGEQK